MLAFPCLGLLAWSMSVLTSQFSSGEPPKPTLPSHWFASQVLHPSSTASSAEALPASSERYAASVAAVNGPPHVLITMGRPGELLPALSAWAAACGSASVNAASELMPQQLQPRMKAMGISMAARISEMRRQFLARRGSFRSVPLAEAGVHRLHGCIAVDGGLLIEMHEKAKPSIQGLHNLRIDRYLNT